MARRGFTYIELTVTLVVLMLIVTLVMPNLKHMAEGEQIASFKSDLKTIPVSAREFAVSRGKTVEVAYHDESSELTISTVEETASAGQNDIAPPSDDGTEGSRLRTLAVPNLVKATSFLVEGSETDSGNWALRFYADGTSEAGGVGFEAGDYKFALTVRDDGRGAQVDGDVPDLSTEKWKAGDFEQRTQ